MQVRCPNCHESTEVDDSTELSAVTCASCGSHFSLVGEETLTYTEGETKAFGRFELRDQLGVGAFGAVWLAHDTQLDRSVAIKIPRNGKLDAKGTEQFVREARAAAQLTHPNIMAVHEVGREDGQVYIVSDYVEGLTLADWLIGQHFTSRTAAALCITLAEALHHAHEAGVVHRDLKPTNIIIDGANEPHIMDFGLAKREAGDVTMTMQGKVLGTPAYMSPEQARGDAHQADRRSDVYSLGVILYELLTGHRPFRGNVRMLLQQVINEEPPSPRKLNSSVPADMETICLKCLEKEPNKRYADAKSLARELQRFIDGEPIQARPISKPERLWRWCRRNPAMAGLCGGLAAVLLVLGIGGPLVAITQTKQARKQTQLASRNKELVDSERRTNAELAEKNKQITQTLVDQALAAAMSGNSERTVHFLDTARQSGLSEARTEFITGVMYWASGQHETASSHLHRAVELDKDSVAPRSVLASIYGVSGQADKFFKMLAEARSREPKTAEDSLFLGFSSHVLSPRNAKRLIERSLDVHESPIAQAMYAQVLPAIALQNGNMNLAEKARKEVAMAETILGRDNRFVTSTKLHVLNASIVISRDSGDETSSLEVAAAKTASQLIEAAHLRPVDWLTIAEYRERILGDIPAARRAFEKAIQLESGDVYRSYFAAFLLNHVGIDESINQLESIERGMGPATSLHLLMLALHPVGNERARTMWREIGEMGGYQAKWGVLAAVMLGLESDARSMSAKWKPKEPEYRQRTMEFLTGDVEFEAFLPNGVENASNESRFIVGLKALGQRRRTDAVAMFEAIVESSEYTHWVYPWAEGFRSQLSRDPDWPYPLPSESSERGR